MSFLTSNEHITLANGVTIKGGYNLNGTINILGYEIFAYVSLKLNLPDEGGGPSFTEPVARGPWPVASRPTPHAPAAMPPCRHAAMAPWPMAHAPGLWPVRLWLWPLASSFWPDGKHTRLRTPH